MKGAPRRSRSLASRWLGLVGRSSSFPVPDSCIPAPSVAQSQSHGQFRYGLPRSIKQRMLLVYASPGQLCQHIVPKARTQSQPAPFPAGQVHRSRRRQAYDALPLACFTIRTCGLEAVGASGNCVTWLGQWTHTGRLGDQHCHLASWSLCFLLLGRLIAQTIKAVARNV
jgi:hypothetical protein